MLFIYILLTIIFLFSLWLFLIMPGKSSSEQRAPIYGFNYAHRGLHTKDKTRPENSLAAFEAAASAGYGMELDIQLTKDGHVVVFHDNTLKRVCGEGGRVDSYTLAELQNFHLCGTAEKPPLFTDVLHIVNARVPIIVELKMHPSRNDELCQKAYNTLKDYSGAYCIESFDPRIVCWFKKNAPEILRGQLASTKKDLGSGIAGMCGSRLFGNCLARPHFIAYSTKKQPLSARVARHFAMKAVWTVRPGNDIANLEKENDAVIFEFYTPKPKYKD